MASTSVSSPPDAILSNEEFLCKLESGGKEWAISWLNDACQRSVSKKGVNNCIDRILQKQRQLKKTVKSVRGQIAYKQWLAQDVLIPEARQARSAETDPCLCQCEYASVATKLALELKSVQDKLSATQDKLNKTSSDFTLLKKSRALRTDLTKEREQNKKLQRANKSLKKKLEIKNLILKRVRVDNTRLKKQKEDKNEVLVAEINALHDQMKHKDELQAGLAEVEKLRETLNEAIVNCEYLQGLLSDNSDVTCFLEEAGKYSPQTRECIFQLLQLNVPSRSICPVITCVLKLAGKTVSKLPAKSTILEMNVERLVLAQKQLSEQLPSKRNTTLYTDETTKFGVKYSGYHASDEEGRLYVLGMRNIVTKSANDTLAGLKNILDDIDRRSEAQDNMQSKKILVNITATMSDRAATEVKFNSLLEDLRKDVLPQIQENWDDLSAADQLAASELINFFCGLHSLVHFAEAASVSLAELDRGIFDNSPPIYDKSFYKVKESGTARLVRTTSNALARGGDEKSGRYGDFKTFIAEYLREKGLHSLPLEPYHGQRFNILFENSVAFFFLHKKIQEYLEVNQGNNLLKAVLHDLKVEHYLAGGKALGLVSRFVTGPLWSLLEARDIHIFEMNKYYLMLMEKLNYAALHLEEFMRGDVLVFEQATVVKADVMLDALLEEWEHDEKVKVCLSVIIPALAMVTNKLFKDHLPGGKWENCTEEMKAKSTGTHKHNKFAESAFGFLDKLLRKSPNISALSAEAYLMFLSNRTLQWLQSKCEKDKTKLIEAARKEARSTKNIFRERALEIKRRHLVAQAEAAEKLDQQRRKKIATLEKYTTAIIYYGLWQTESQVDAVLETLPTSKEKKEALKAQLNFRQHLLNQEKKSVPEFSSVFAFSKKVDQRTVECGIDELTLKVKALVRQAFTIPMAPPSRDVPFLVGKRVSHTFKKENEDEGPGISYHGKVISQVPGYPEWFNIVYDSEQQAVYTYKLLDDWRQGSLHLLV